jgi:cytochrome c biogenesis protein
MKEILRFLTSVRLTIVLLVLIAVLSIVGTFIPQQEGAADFAARLSPETVSLLTKLQIFDLYHSPLFLFLLGMLSLNLVVCSLRRFPATWKKIDPQPFPPPESLFDDLSADQLMTFNGTREKAHEAVKALLEKKGAKINHGESPQGTFFFFQQGRYSHLGVYAVHAGVLVIVAGMVISALFGFEGYVTLAEGQSKRDIEVMGEKGHRTLDFAVRCERFVLEFYENGVHKTYRSDLSFLRKGRVVQQGCVLVNHPLSFGGLRFYQSSYGALPGGKAHLAYTGENIESRQLVLKAGDVFKLRERAAVATVLRIEENMMGMGPAVKLRIVFPQGENKLWVYQRIEEIERANPGLLSAMPIFNPGHFKPYQFSLSGIESPYFTGLQVRSDPGVPFVAIGGFFMITGFLITFWISHSRFWIRIDEEKGKVRIAVAGKSSRNLEALAKDIGQLCSSLREAIKV